MALTEARIRELFADYNNDRIHWISDLETQLINETNRSLDDVALELLGKGGFSYIQKLQLIKEVRIRTNSGLIEAKEAVERAIVTYLRAELVKAETCVSRHTN